MVRTIGAPAEDVWELLSRFELWPKWGPMVRRVRSDHESVAAGVTGRVATIFGVSLPFEISDVEEGEFWDWKVGGVPVTGHRLRALGSGRCEVTFSVPIVFYPYKVVLGWGLRLLQKEAESGRN